MINKIKNTLKQFIEEVSERYYKKKARELERQVYNVYEYNED